MGLFLFFIISIGILVIAQPVYAELTPSGIGNGIANALIITAAKLVLLLAQILMKLTVFF